MRQADVATLIDFNYWCNRQILGAAEPVSAANLSAPSEFTYRSLRGTLVHTLDIEWSWRIRLRGEQADQWDSSLDEHDYATVADIAAHWQRDETAMRDWVAALTNEQLAAVADVGTSDRYPLWHYFVHLVTHSEQQRRDAQMLLRAYGVVPPDLEFLYYVDTLPKVAGAG